MKTKNLIIAGAIVGGVTVGLLAYNYYFTTPKVIVSEVDKKKKVIKFRFNHEKFELEYAELLRPVEIKGRLKFLLRIIKVGNCVEFHKLKEGHLVEPPLVVDIA